MLQVLLAQPSDWTNTARLPAMLARVGMTCDLIDPGNTYAACSTHVRTRTAVAGGIEAIAAEVLRVADRYDRVLIGDERLIRTLMQVGGSDADSILRGARSGLTATCDKTLFSPAARAGEACASRTSTSPRRPSKPSIPQRVSVAGSL